MATLVKNPQKTQPRGNRQGRKKAQMIPGQRWKQRFLYAVKHPIDFLWSWLSSVRTAIFLISAIAVICLLGIYFIQAPGEVLGDPVAYAAWVQQNALPRYGSLSPIYDWLQFFTIFSSWYFMLLLTILALSIVVCTLNRAPAIWQNFAHPLLRRSDKFYQNALERSEFTRAGAVEWTRAALRTRRYRVRSQVEVQDGNEVTYLYANKNSWATLSTFVFHAALVTLLLAGVVSQWHGFPPGSPARRFLPAPLISLTDNLAGFTFDQALPDGTSAIVYPRGTPHNISFRANSFTATFDPKTGLPTDYVTDLSVYQDGELVAHSNHLRVNDPLTYNGVVFHQSSLIPSANITITDKQGNVLFNDSVVLDQSSTAPSGKVFDFARDISIADTNQTLDVFFSHDPGVQLAQVPNSPLIIRIGTPNSDAAHSKAFLQLMPGQSRQSSDKEWTIKLNSSSEATVLLVTKDAGSILIWPTAILLILSLCVTFYFPQRRIWVRIQGEKVQMAALREHFTNIRTDLLGVAREA
jgi:cytochrome c biogenesis protein